MEIKTLTDAQKEAGFVPVRMVYQGYTILAKGKKLGHWYKGEGDDYLVTEKKLGTERPGTIIWLARNLEAGKYIPKQFVYAGSIAPEEAVRLQLTSKTVYDQYEAEKSKVLNNAPDEVEEAIKALRDVYKRVGPSQKNQLIARLVHEITK